MASLTKVKGRPSKKTGRRGTTWRIDFFLPDDPKRKQIRLGKMSEKQAESIKTKVELLIAAKVTGTAPDLDVSQWVAKRDNEFHAKLVEHGLVTPRTKVEITTLRAFLDDYIAGRTDIKASTLTHLGRARQSLIDYFGAEKPLHEITPGDADDFRRQLKGADNTVRRICGRAKQFFRAAARKRLITESPFADMKATSVKANRARDYFVTRKEAQAVLDACPDNQWRLLFALCRYGGLRCPSEPLVIRWGDVDWEHDRIMVDSPKTGPRNIPIFPELRPHLEKAWDEAPEGTEFVITRYRDRNCNLRTQLCRVIKKAKLTPWPKLFQNLRSTRETELLNEGWKIHQVCAWIGNSEPVAMEHYLQVTETDYAKAGGKGTGKDEETVNEETPADGQNAGSEKAQQKAQQNTSQDAGMERQGSEQECENPGDFENRRDSLVGSAPPVGLEPSSLVLGTR
jgi:integrase